MDTLETRMAALEAKFAAQQEEYKLVVADLYSWLDSRIAALKEDSATIAGYGERIDAAVAAAKDKLELTVGEFSKSLAKEHIITGIADAVKGAVIAVRPATRAEVQAGQAVATRQATPSELRN